jgi:hypothetical protein
MPSWVTTDYEVPLGFANQGPLSRNTEIQDEHRDEECLNDKHSCQPPAAVVVHRCAIAKIFPLPAKNSPLQPPRARAVLGSAALQQHKL